MILHFVETLANSPLWVGLCGFGLVVLPILGIMTVHNNVK